MDAARRDRDAAIASEAAAVAAAAAAVAALEHERSVRPHHYLLPPPGQPVPRFPEMFPPPSTLPSFHPKHRRNPCPLFMRCMRNAS